MTYDTSSCPTAYLGVPDAEAHSHPEGGGVHLRADHLKRAVCSPHDNAILHNVVNNNEDHNDNWISQVLLCEPSLMQS